MIINKYVKFSQEQIDMYMFKLNIEDILRGTAVLRFDPITGKNYQREPVPAHYRKIAKYLMTTNKAIMPTAILGAIDEKDIFENEEGLNISAVIRIVDGQHRIYGMEYLKDGKYSTKGTERFAGLKDSFEFPIILMVLKEEDELVEVDAFININNTGKKVKTDLAEALKSKKYYADKTDESLYKVDDSFLNSLSYKLATNLAKNDSFWSECILLPNETGVKPISVLAFMRAIRPIVDVLFYGKDTIGNEEVKILESEFYTLFKEMWSEVINRWSECFNNEQRTYDKKFNICKGIGVYPLCQIFADCLRQGNGVSDFVQIIQKSNVKYGDWYVGGHFSGNASRKGFDDIRRIIIGEINKEDLGSY